MLHSFPGTYIRGMRVRSQRLTKLNLEFQNVHAALRQFLDKILTRDPGWIEYESALEDADECIRLFKNP